MKKTGMLFMPIIVVALMAFFGKQLFSGRIDPMTMLIIAAVAFGLMMFIKPKKSASGSTNAAAMDLLGEYAKDAFSYDEKLHNKFMSAVNDHFNAMPKSAYKKLTELEPLCKTDDDTYAHSIALALSKISNEDYEGAIKLYNKAVVIHPSAQLAEAIGSLHQRMGELEKAIDAYQFAMDLDPSNLAILAKVATVYVADGDFESGIEHAQLVLDREENNASALATIAICHGALEHGDLYKGYTVKAVENGYDEGKITNTVTALKKKYKKTLESLK